MKSCKMPHKESTTGSPSEFAAQLSIIIVGAGLSGLAAAIQSALGGHSVLVLESTKELTEVSHTIPSLQNIINTHISSRELTKFSH